MRSLAVPQAPQKEQNDTRNCRKPEHVADRFQAVTCPPVTHFGNRSDIAQYETP